MNTLRKFIKNEYIYSVFSRGITIILGMLHSVIVARYLGASLKGTTTYVQSITAVGSIVVTFGMHQAYPYFRKKYGKEEIYQDYLSVVVMLYSFYMVLALALAAFLPISIEVRAAIVLIPILGYANVVEYVSLVEAPNLRNSLWMVWAFVEVVFDVCLLLFTKSNFFFAMLILFFASFAHAVVYTIMLKPRLRISKKQKKLTIELFKFGLLPMIALLLTSFNYRIDVFMLEASEFISDAQLGVYSIGIMVAEKIILIPDTLKGVMVSKLTKGADETEVAKVSRISFVASCVICVCILIVGEWGIRLLFGPQYDGAYEVLLISAFGAVCVGNYKLVAQYNIVNGKQIRNVLMLSVSILVNIIGNKLFVPHMGILGAGLATGISYFLCGFVFVIWFAGKHQIKLWDMLLIKKSDLQKLKKTIKKT